MPSKDGQPDSAKDDFLVFVLWVGIALSCLVHPEVCFGADSTGAVTLEGYLKQLGYEGLDFENSDHEQPRIEALLSNGRKARLLVDTGWGVTSLSPAYARGLKTLGELGIQLQDPVLGTLTNRDLVLIDKLVLAGSAKFSNQPAQVRDLKADYISVPFDGVLGLDFLARNFCLIDCWKHRLYVRPAELSAELAQGMDKSLRLGGLSEVRLRQHRSLDVDVEINGHSTSLLIDTGARVNLLDKSQLKELGLSLEHFSRPSTGSLIEREQTTDIIGMGKIGLHHAKVTKLDSFQLGQRKWKDVLFAVTDLGDWGAAAPRTRHEYIKGVLSQEFLASHGALIDVVGHKLWLRAAKRPSEPR